MSGFRELAHRWLSALFRATTNRAFDVAEFCFARAKDHDARAERRRARRMLERSQEPGANP
ncbi:hypothetical protein QM467_04630 [Rhodoblastus sp. 17X3]|uniref:hypothetical protein n=1 Tax=Rhodoblastus sp. 17X3 TaxID=3047026 RepID=UPI0024B82490|nr:hypothetical protein [Rhodoblastus sp. 17X3]MDI9847345.1 hypothetical protein [Rhodoblastus sp. 17X3]